MQFVTYYDNRLATWLTKLNLTDKQAKDFVIVLDRQPQNYRHIQTGNMQTLAANLYNEYLKQL